MTAGGENAGLHRRWLERKLEIEVGKVQAKLLSKGLSVPVPDPDALETEARLAQAHLPKLYIDLYGRNPNGTLKLGPDPNKRHGPLPPSTLVQKLDRMLNPALLTPIPFDVAMAHGLPLSCCDGDGGDVLASSAALLARDSGACGAGGGGSSSAWGSGGRGRTGQGGNVTESGSSPRVNRTSPPPQIHCRPDLQAVDARIDDAVAEVHRVALQANEMSPRERVLYLAREANPHFSLPKPRSVQLASAGAGPGAGGSRRELLRKSLSRRVTSFTPDPTVEAAGGGGWGGGGGGGGRPHRVQASASRRSLAAAESRRSRSSSSASVLSPYPSGGTNGDGSLPPLASQSRSVSRIGSSSRDAAQTSTELALHAGAAATAGAAARPSGDVSEALEALPRLSPSVSPVPWMQPGGGGEAEGDDHRPLAQLPKLPPVHSGGEASGYGRVSLTSVKAEVIGLWGAAAIVHAAEVASARAAAEAQARAEEEAAAQAEAEAAAAEAEAEAAAAAAEAALEAEVEAEARVAAGLLSQAPAVADGGASSVARSGGYRKHRSSGGAGGLPRGHTGDSPVAAVARGETRGSAASSRPDLHGGSHAGSSGGWVP
ncbi:hypothetical protein PLESTB_001404000 [Pleodorina starrii]|uniref:Uncharacterized protein n=1 Tax=Pleodorina starrii TaxID=330485 RepID=A0A9W6F756_9CHLO|nr:hypothetical protein PLESTB_001404000 [Pleodorina starrii]GLC68745.1 hypothetical protein PLESTF_000730700 [Pleodorina starrii]